MSLYQEIKQEHLLCTQSGITPRSAFCSCEDAFYYWEVREESHELHVIAEFENALRAQIAADIRAAADAADVDFIQVGNAHVRRNPYASGHYEEAARIAEEGTTK